MGGGAKRVTARDIANAGSLQKLIERFIDQVKNGTMEAKERAVTSLHSLTGQPPFEGEEKTENAVLIAAAAGVAPMVALVRDGSAVAKTHACGALAAIVLKCPDSQQQILEANGLPPITAALRLGDAAVQQNVVALLASLSRLQSTQQAIINTGVIPTLVALLKGGASNETLMHVCLTLANLADQNVDSQNRIAKAGALPLLITLLEAGKAPDAVATALARLSAGHDANRAEVTRLGGIPRLIALLAVINVDVQAQAAAALAALAKGDNSDQKDVVAEAGGIRGLLALIDSRNMSTQQSSVNALAMLASNNPRNQESIANLGGIAPLVALCDSGNPVEVQEQAVLALNEISRHNQQNQTSGRDTARSNHLAQAATHLTTRLHVDTITLVCDPSLIDPPTSSISLFDEQWPMPVPCPCWCRCCELQRWRRALLSWLVHFGRFRRIIPRTRYSWRKIQQFLCFVNCSDPRWNELVTLLHMHWRHLP